MLNDPSRDSEQVRQVMESYVRGTYTGDAELLKRCFHPKAAMSGYLGNQLIIATPEPFFQDIAGSPSMETAGYNYQGEIKSLQVTGEIALAVLYETEFRGSVTMESHFQLIRENGVWMIISKNFTTIG
ncbi:MAG: nuclear transport factor 2 family protein [Oscillospiraceae bacterium]|jgi:hypothetical protein|nr:nuclear transport factor 2 family protein [Oscillospiraceae bacterium]